jgi:histidinol-phosphate phosphatase family protein
MASPQRNSKLFGPLRAPLGLGLLRLSTESRPSTLDSITLIHAALDQGIRVIDTADSYCLDNDDFHYGEVLAAQAVASWHGPKNEVRLLTKVGLARPNGKWIPNASPKHIAKSVDASLVALGTDRIFLLQLHAKDSRVPFEETLGALAELQKQGKVEHLGLCNVSPADVRQAMRHFSVASVQCELSIQSRKSAEDGMLVLTQELGIPFLAHRPLGGYAKVEKLAKNRVLGPLAARHQATPFEIALAAVLHAAPHVIPLIGATKLASLESSMRATHIALDVSDQTALSIKYSFDADEDSVAAIRPAAKPVDLPQLEPDAGPSDSPEVVLLMGIQGAGKSELVQAYVDRGYARLNRDLIGGKVDDLTGHLQQLLSQGEKRVVLDNTYPTRVSRAGVVRVSHASGLPVRCRWLETSIEDARINVVLRVLNRYERLLGPADMKELAKQDPNLPPPIAMQRWLDSLEKPEWDEGFSAIDRIPFVRRTPADHVNKGLLLDVDGTLRTTASGEIYPRHADDVVLLPNRREILRKWLDDGYQLFFVSNQSGIASGKLSQADAESAFQRTVDLLGLPVTEVTYCPHPAFPVGCFCRKPMPGLGVYLARKYGLDLNQSMMVGDMESDEAFAESIGVRYVDANDFFASVVA